MGEVFFAVPFSAVAFIEVVVILHIVIDNLCAIDGQYNDFMSILSFHTRV